jgi:dienelactone hydrolase
MRFSIFSSLLVLSSCINFSLSYAAEPDALLCRPDGRGPFPAVVYSHGQVANPQMLKQAQQGGWKRTCERLAADGFLAFIPIREFSSDRKPPQVFSNKNELSQAIDHVKSLPEVDPSRVTLMGHSRGGLLTLMVGLERKDLKALIITAPASISPYFSQEVARLSLINAPVLLLVEVSDEMGSLGAVNILDETLRKQGKEVRTIRYDRGGGHFLFIGSGDLYWWDDVRAFLREKLL